MPNVIIDSKDDDYNDDDDDEEEREEKTAAAEAAGEQMPADTPYVLPAKQPSEDSSDTSEHGQHDSFVCHIIQFIKCSLLIIWGLTC